MSEIEKNEKNEDTVKSIKISSRKYMKYVQDECSLRNDDIFKIVFGRNKNREILKDFLEAILNKKISNLMVRNEVTLEKIFKHQKTERLDLLVETDEKEIINVEIQNKNEYNVIERGIAYSSSIISNSLEKGKPYADMDKTIIIWLLGFDMFEDNENYHEKGYLVRESNREKITEKVEYHYIQMPKFFRQIKEICSPEEQWIAYISHQLNEEELGALFKMNDKIKKAEEIIKMLRDDPELRYEIWRIRMAEYDRIDRESVAKKQDKIEIAKKMLEDNMDIQEIIKYTGLTEEEIKKLSNN
jgi:predicted transposase/invertase (TIGR01784 family)